MLFRLLRGLLLKFVVFIELLFVGFWDFLDFSDRGNVDGMCRILR